jgi:hypothetical protein
LILWPATPIPITLAKILLLSRPMAQPPQVDVAQLAPRQPPGRQALEVLLIVVVFFTIAGDLPPAVNEAHYLTRLKHYWSPAWCAGDLFLESNDAQLVFIWTFGWVTRFASLPATAWLGRLLAWTLIAWAWQRLSWRIAPMPLGAVLSAALFVTLNERFHLAGEWVVGGVEAKCFAYAFVLLALAALLPTASDPPRPIASSGLSRPLCMWLSLGAATAFHPIVGGWSAVVAGPLWLWQQRPSISWRATFPGLVGFAILASLGVVPALMLMANAPDETAAEAAHIYVFERLPHHLALLTLPDQEIAIRIGRHAALLLGLWILSHRLKTMNGVQAAPQVAIVRFAWGAVLLAAIGFAIELAFRNQPLVAARLLRYYWFRLTDFAAPMAVALCFTALIATGLKRKRGWAAWLLAAAIVGAGVHIASAVRMRLLHPFPPADATTRDFQSWEDACAWIAQNTPPRALFITPRLNHTFKWRTGRPEVVNRKDIPQDARSILEWHRRIHDIYETQIDGEETMLDSLGILGTDRVRQLALKYHADYVLIDRGQLISLPRAFWNEEYVVYRIEK